MILEFTKMNGAGNDFVMIDNRDGSRSFSREQITHLCDRHRGIGGDGLIAVEGTPESLRMRYYNADGGEAEMCGNGARCFARFAARLIGLSEGTISFQTMAGPISAELLGEQVRLRMSEPHSLQLAHSLKVEGLDLEVHSINTGVPHAVTFVSELESTPVVSQGRPLRHHQRFAPAGTNANFAQVLAPGSLSIRTYERGVEDETLACGTGVVASALIHHLRTGAPSPVRVRVRGGDTLEVGFQIHDGHPTSVTLTGPADFVFEGSITP
jgi:diaminopimelate epimerase